MDKQEAIKILKEFHDKSALFSVRTALETVFPELKEDEDELEWLKQFIQEEVDSLSIDIRDNEDQFRLKMLKRSLEWLEKQGEKKPVWSEEDDGYKLVALSAFLNYYDEENPLRKCLINWLKSLKQRMGG